MDIFESLENLNVSEKCFNDIVQTIINELEEKTVDRARDQAYMDHEDKIRDLERQYKSPTAPDDIDTLYANHLLNGEIGAEEEEFQKRMDKFRKTHDKWIDWKRGLKKK